MGKTVHKLFYKFDATIYRVYRLSLDKLSKKCIIKREVKSMWWYIKAFFTILILSLTIELARDDIRVALGLRRLYKNNNNNKNKVIEIVLPTKGSETKKSDFYFIPWLAISIGIFLLGKYLIKVESLSYAITFIGLSASVLSKHYSNKTYKRMSAKNHKKQIIVANDEDFNKKMQESNIKAKCSSQSYKQKGN